MQIYLVFAIIISVLAVIFAVQNTAPVEVNFILWKFTQPLAIVLLVSLAVGAVIALLTSMPTMIKDKWAGRTLRKKLGELQNQVEGLQTELTGTRAKIVNMEAAKLEAARLAAAQAEALTEAAEAASPNGEAGAAKTGGD
jgi:uncharacterized integral membrane protein